MSHARAGIGGGLLGLLLVGVGGFAAYRGVEVYRHKLAAPSTPVTGTTPTTTAPTTTAPTTTTPTTGGATVGGSASSSPATGVTVGGSSGAVPTYDPTKITTMPVIPVAATPATAAQVLADAIKNLPPVTPGTSTVQNSADVKGAILNDPVLKGIATLPNDQMVAWLQSEAARQAAAQVEAARLAELQRQANELTAAQQLEAARQAVLKNLGGSAAPITSPITTQPVVSTTGTVGGSMGLIISKPVFKSPITTMPIFNTTDYERPEPRAWRDL